MSSLFAALQAPACAAGHSPGGTRAAPHEDGDPHCGGPRRYTFLWPTASQPTLVLPAATPSCSSLAPAVMNWPRRRHACSTHCYTDQDEAALGTSDVCTARRHQRRACQSWLACLLPDFVAQPGLGAHASFQVLFATPRSEAPRTHMAFGAWGVPGQPGIRSSSKLPPSRGHYPARIRALPG